MRRRRPLSSLEEEAAINLTPLIDVVFVILIMFIVIAPMLDIDRIALASSGEARKEQASVQEKSLITLQVTANNGLSLNKRPLELKELALALSLAKEKHPKAKLQLFHDKNASFGTYQQIKNSAEVAGFEEMDVILTPRSSG